MSRSPNRASESAAIKALDSRPAVCMSEIAKISTKLMQGIIDHEHALVRLIKDIDNLVGKARGLGLEIHESETPSSDAIQRLHGMTHAIESTGKQFNAMLDMDADKWIEMAKLLGVE